MRYMVIVTSCPEFESAQAPDADADVMAAMVNDHEELAQAGVLLDGSGLKPSREGWRIHYGADGRHVVDGPYAEAKELIAGYTRIQVRSREEAPAWSRRFPQPGSRRRRSRGRSASTVRT